MPPKRVYFCKGKCYQRITKISWPLHKIKTVAIHKCDLRFWFRKSWVDVDFCVSFHVVILFCWYDFHWNLVWVAKIRAHLIFQWWMNLKITLNEIISKIIQQENWGCQSNNFFYVIQTKKQPTKYENAFKWQP